MPKSICHLSTNSCRCYKFSFSQFLGDNNFHLDLCFIYIDQTRCFIFPFFHVMTTLKLMLAYTVGETLFRECCPSLLTPLSWCLVVHIADFCPLFSLFLEFQALYFGKFHFWPPFSVKSIIHCKCARAQLKST